MAWVLLVPLEQLVLRVLPAFQVHVGLADFLEALDSPVILDLAARMAMTVFRVIRVALDPPVRPAHLV